jgi:transposase InsO family protein
MAWKMVDKREQRVRFVVQASQGQKNLSELCREFGISRPTGYLWLRRWQQEKTAGLEEKSRRPQHSPQKTAGAIEQQIVELRQQRPDWGARKLRPRLLERGVGLPVITLHRVLLRHGLVRVEDRHEAAVQRFERAAPNELWQMDFKSPKGWEQRVGPLTVIDDHSRYLIRLAQTGTTRSWAVRAQLEQAFEECGMPQAMLMDHGTPWWNAAAPSGWTELTVWLMRQGIRLHFGRYRHPQTQGKVERFHGALEMARRRRGLPGAEQRQAWLEEFRYEYNHVRGHEALGMATPASVWRASERRFAAHPPEWDYGAQAEVHRLDGEGRLRLGLGGWPISGALSDQRVQVQRVGESILLVYYCQNLVREIDLAAQRSTAVDRWAQPSTCKACPDNTL